MNGIRLLRGSPGAPLGRSCLWNDGSIISHLESEPPDFLGVECPSNTIEQGRWRTEM